MRVEIHEHIRLALNLIVHIKVTLHGCAVFGDRTVARFSEVCLFAFAREYPFVPNAVYMLGSGMGWWLAIVLMAGIREKIAYSKVIPGLEGIGITFIATGILAMSFMGFSGINLRNPQTGKLHPHYTSTATPKAGALALGSPQMINSSSSKHKLGKDIAVSTSDATSKN